jgi:SagB-type dehydrogenase family enzyme
MAERSSDELLGLARDSDAIWEIFHESSKNFRQLLNLSERSGSAVQAEMQKFHESLPFPGYASIALPPLPELECSLDRALTLRQSTRNLTPRVIRLEELTLILHHAYGMVRENTYVPFPPRTRAVPSAGALYPLEIYFYAATVADLAPGLYHFSSKEHCLHLLRPLEAACVWEATLYPDFARGAALSLFVTALFERSTWKYGSRGYRYALIEAGAVAQNIALVAAALDLGCFNLGGYIDREIDELLELDGVTHSTLHMLCVGGRR